MPYGVKCIACRSCSRAAAICPQPMAPAARRARRSARSFFGVRLMRGRVEHITPFTPSSASEWSLEVLPSSPVVCMPALVRLRQAICPQPVAPAARRARRSARSAACPRPCAAGPPGRGCGTCVVSMRHFFFLHCILVRGPGASQQKAQGWAADTFPLQAQHSLFSTLRTQCTKHVRHYIQCNRHCAGRDLIDRRALVASARRSPRAHAAPRRGGARGRPVSAGARPQTGHVRLQAREHLLKRRPAGRVDLRRLHRSPRAAGPRRGSAPRKRHGLGQQRLERVSE